MLRGITNLNVNLQGNWDFPQDSLMADRLRHPAPIITWPNFLVLCLFLFILKP